MTDAPTRRTPPTQTEAETGQKRQIDYPNYSVWQTRSGNVPWFVSDTKGNEFIKVQHRTGTSWEMTHDGRLKLVTSMNREDITFGKQISYVTGSQDTHIEGDRSVLTYGSDRSTTHGDNEVSIKGKHITTAKSMNMMASEQFDVASQQVTVKSGSTLVQAADGPVTLSAKTNALLSSEEGSTAIISQQGAATIEAGMKVSVKGNEVHISGGGGEVVMKDGKVYINSSLYQSPEQVWSGKEQGGKSNEPSYEGIPVS